MTGLRRDFYVYILFRPNGHPCYVGKGQGDRWLHHERRPSNRHLKRIIRKAGGTIPRIKVREDLLETEAFETEIALITAIGRKDLGRGPLVNLTGGGEGGGLALETRFKMSLSHMGKKHSAAHAAAVGAALKGRKKSPEFKALLSRIRRGKPKGPITEKRREAIRAAVTAFWDRQRQAGLPMRHPGGGKGQLKPRCT